MKNNKKYIRLFLIVSLFLFPVFAAAQEGEVSDTAITAPEQTASAAAEPETVAAPEKSAAEALTHEVSPEAAQNKSGDTLVESLEEATEESGIIGASFIKRLGIALAIVVAQALLILLVWALFKRLNKKVLDHGGEKIKPLTIKKLKLLSVKQIIDLILISLRILKYVITAIQLFMTLPIVFSLFPATENLASTLFGYILHPLQNIFFGMIRYIPNLFTIVIIIAVTHYVIKALKFFSTQITKGKLVLRGFYADWAAPTFKILQVLLWAFTVAIVYPYLPGSDSKIFQGVSVFIGIIFSLGSSSAIGNLVAGLVITYMRPFKIGDRVKITEITGFVVEKNLMVVRLKTHKNEYVTFPNTLILSSGIINYNTSSDEDAEGLILNAEITYGYATPWETIHEILINAALATDHIQKRPKPFVLQTALDDFYVRYQINCYTKEVDKVPAIYTQLFENIQNGFREAEIDMTSPHYGIFIARKDG
jgi:small-conductance mechanosensitive channel